MRHLKYLLLWPLANLRQHRWVSVVSVVGVGAAAFVVVTLLGFLDGYRTAVRHDVDRMGFDLLITAKGCPYEAATLMLRGGVGLRYMPDGVVEDLRRDPAVAGTYPTLIHLVREPGNPRGMTIFKGVSPGFFDVRGLELLEGEWFARDAAIDEARGVVLGFEAAEYEQRHAGDPYLIPGGDGREPTKTTVLGVLQRTGTQIDGSVLLPVGHVQALFDLPGKLTGVGVRGSPDQPGRVEEIRERYHDEPELQVVSLSQVEQALKRATRALRDVVGVLAWILAAMAGAIMLNTAVLRTLGDQRRFFVLHAIGFHGAFIYGAALVENLLLVLLGAGAGLLAAWALGPWSTDVLVSYLPYAPKGDLVRVPVEVVAATLGGAAVLGTVATALPLLRLWRTGDLTGLRGG